MTKERDSVIIYHSQMDKCRKYMTAEQFGRLMIALLDFDKGLDPDVDDDIALAFEFISLQNEIDREKYEEKCRRNRANGKKGGRPKKGEEKPKKANGFFENPNKNENDNENKNENDNENKNENKEAHDDSLFHGQFNNVRLSETEHAALKQHYERTDELIDKVSLWLRTAKNDVPDHYGLCLKFAANDDWPKRRVIEPVRPIIVEDPLSEEEQQRKVADMRARLNGAIKSV